MKKDGQFIKMFKDNIFILLYNIILKYINILNIICDLILNYITLYKY